MSLRTLLARCATAALPVVGAVTLGFAVLQTGTQPDRAELEHLRQLTDELNGTHRQLSLTPPQSQDALTERLPRTLTVGAMLQRLERAARQADVRAVSFGTEGAADPGQEDVAEQPNVTTPEDSGPQPEVLRCQITIECDYCALVQFLGLVEAMPAITRVRSLAVTPQSSGVSATIGLIGFAYAGDGRATAPAATSAPGGER